MERLTLMLITLFIVSQYSFAADKVYVETTRDYPSQGFPSNKFKIKKNKNADVMAPDERDLILKQAGLAEYTDKMDHLDKDVLMIRARTLDLKKLEQKYPQIPSSKLGELKKSLPKK